MSCAAALLPTVSVPLAAVRLTVLPLTPDRVPPMMLTSPTARLLASTTVTALPAFATARVLMLLVADARFTVPAAVIATFLLPRMPPAVPSTPPPVLRCRLPVLAGVTSVLIVIAPAVALPTSRCVTVKLPNSALSSAKPVSRPEPRSMVCAAVGFTTALAAVTPAPTFILSAVSVRLS